MMDEKMEDKIDEIEDEIKEIRAEFPDLKQLDLYMENFNLSMKLHLQDALKTSNKELESKLDARVRQTLRNQKERISWGMEILRFAIVTVMFILSIKLV